MRRVAKFRLLSGLPVSVVSILKVCRGVNQISQATPLAAQSALTCSTCLLAMRSCASKNSCGGMGCISEMAL